MYCRCLLPDYKDKNSWSWLIVEHIDELLKNWVSIATIEFLTKSIKRTCWIILSDIRWKDVLSFLNNLSKRQKLPLEVIFSARSGRVDDRRSLLQCENKDLIWQTLQQSMGSKRFLMFDVLLLDWPFSQSVHHLQMPWIRNSFVFS